MKQQKSRGNIKIDPIRCKGCGLCVWACPEGAIRPADKVNHRGIRVACLKDRHNCTGCSFCAIICPDVAIEVYRERRSNP